MTTVVSTKIGGTNLQTIGTAGQALKVNSTGTGLEWGSVGGAINVANEITTNSSGYYILFTNAASGNITSTNVATSKLYFNPSTGTVSATNFNSLSDLQEKENVETLKNAVEMLANIRGVRFTWKETGAPSLGVIAQELLQVAPELVTRNEQGVHTVNYAGLNAILIEAMKDLHTQVQLLRTEIENLKNGNSTGG
jgi:hypothetical protein